jgi:hypothetical protein
MAKESGKVSEFEDTTLVAYLHCRGFKFEPFRASESERVKFRVYGDIDTVLAEFYQNVSINIQDFVKCLKIVRSCLFNTKNASNITKGE